MRAFVDDQDGKVAEALPELEMQIAVLEQTEKGENEMTEHREISAIERLAMSLYAGEYSKQVKGIIEFYQELPDNKKARLNRLLDEVLEAAERDGLVKRVNKSTSAR